MIDPKSESRWSWVPRALREPLAVARRDVAHLARRIGGAPIAQTIARTRREVARVAPSATAGRAMRVTAVTRETDDAVSITLACVDHAPVLFAPGQFLTLQVEVDGVTHRRAYSMSSSALDPTQRSVTVRRTAGGVVSNHLNDRVQVGDVLHVLGPSGSFVVARTGARRHVVLVAGGSGITPMMAMLRTHLGAAPEITFTLVYGNRDRAHAIFADALDALAAQHPAQLSVRHVVEALPDGAAGEGRLDAARCDAVFGEIALPRDVEVEWFVCGPDPMMAAVREALAARGVSSSRVHEERFFTAGQSSRAKAPSGAPRRVTIRVDGGERAVVALAGATLLDAGLAAGVDMPFSCTMGGCGACRVRLTEGTVAHDEPNCLSSGERDAGYVLACCARPDGDAVIEVTR